MLDKIVGFARTLRRLSKRQAPTEEHLNVWREFDKVLLYRANVAMFMFFIHYILLIITETTHYEEA